ncbi:uncharacterized protein F5891DRAFT_981553 [Suillus fuscotomentosus]|uniref:Uncharacterized protein n=1 Tax=Suillus fuscotomentosus TaxID=1912939 RepID=A0AAD4E376_9AGAM|nr:uncharacterized protein F5891DRAFT_981553 [Suillus fuscotomentosus]KAG1898898.1 hypothetical protein F5891DRAFT_981553 [Suillus fuscotomentosus]
MYLPWPWPWFGLFGMFLFFTTSGSLPATVNMKTTHIRFFFKFWCIRISVTMIPVLWETLIWVPSVLLLSEMSIELHKHVSDSNTTLRLGFNNVLSFYIPQPRISQWETVFVVNLDTHVKNSGEIDGKTKVKEVKFCEGLLKVILHA